MSSDFDENGRFAKGNKASVGKGRPRTCIPQTDEELVKFGEEMVAWVSDPDNEVLHLSDFYTIEYFYTYEEFKTFIKHPRFFPYYDKARKIVSRNYLKKDSPVDPAVKQRFLRLSFKDLREDEDELLRLKSDLQKEVNAEAKPPEIKVINYGSAEIKNDE